MSVRETDPRLKLLLAGVGIVSTFAAAGPVQLLLPLLLLVTLLSVSGQLGRFLRLVLLFRWFLLFVVLLHLLFSPGRLLFGLFFLSWDGFLRGLLTALQVLVASGFSLLLSSLISAEELAAAGSRVLSPLRRFGLRVDRFTNQLLLTLQMAPLVRNEGTTAFAELTQQRAAEQKRTFLASASALQQVLTAMLNRMLDQIERRAQDDATGAVPLPEAPPLPALRATLTNLFAGLLLVALIVNGVFV